MTKIVVHDDRAYVCLISICLNYMKVLNAQIHSFYYLLSLRHLKAYVIFCQTQMNLTSLKVLFDQK